MNKTNTGLVTYAKAQLGKPYWYGTFGNTATESLLSSKKGQYPSHYTSSRMAKYRSQLGKRVHDCVGLIKGYLWSESPTSLPKYNASQDVSANGMLNKCTKKGKISSIPEIPGVLVFLDGHVGIYEGKGKVLEARGFAYGVVRTNLKDRPWTDWGYCPWITYSSDTVSTTTTTKKPVSEIAKDIIDGVGEWKNCNGTARKTKLESMGYNYAEVQAEINRQLKANSTSITNSKYYSKYSGDSMQIDVVLKAIGVPSTYYGKWSKRKPIAKANGISAYVGSSSQNLKLVNLAKQGKLIKP